MCCGDLDDKLQDKRERKQLIKMCKYKLSDK